jgi:hypothetical protein
MKASMAFFVRNDWMGKYQVIFVYIVAWGFQCGESPVTLSAMYGTTR